MKFPDPINPNALPASEYRVDQHVQVYSFGHWYSATVTKVGRTRLWVLYATGSGAVRSKAFPAVRVRPFPTKAAQPPAPCVHANTKRIPYGCGVVCNNCGARIGD